MSDLLLWNRQDLEQGIAYYEWALDHDPNIDRHVAEQILTAIKSWLFARTHRCVYCKTAIPDLSWKWQGLYWAHACKKQPKLTRAEDLEMEPWNNPWR